jgi:flagellar biogenesis protein FliO
MKMPSSTPLLEGLRSALPFPISRSEVSIGSLQSQNGLLSRAWAWIRTLQPGRPNGKRLQVAATVSLGEKRFVAVINVDGQQFLIGGGASNITLLAQLNPKESFGEVLNETMVVAEKHPAKRTWKHTSAVNGEPTRRQA